MKTKLNKILLGLALLTAVAACGGPGEKPPFEYMPNMTNSPAVKAYEEAPRMPPEGTIPRGFTPYPYSKEDSEKAGLELVNPLPRTAEVFAKGQKLYDTYCIVCHGPKGMGDGPITEKGMPKWNLAVGQANNFPDGHIYNIITKGRVMMPSYASQIKSEDRWAIIHYVRALQKAAKPSSEDVDFVKKMLKEGKVQ